MRGKPDYNYPQFNAAAKALRGLGWYVYNPAEMDVVRDGGPDADTSAFSSLRKYARRDLDVLVDKLRAENGDAIVLLPDWRGSIGARAELATAHWVNLRVLSLYEALTEGWMTG